MKYRYIENGKTLVISDISRCIGCAMCVNVCPHNVFEINNRKVNIVNKEYCMECGACKKNCPVGIIDVRIGVGCANAVINGLITGGEPSCDCSASSKSCCG